MQEEYQTRINGLEKRIGGDFEKLTEKIEKAQELSLKHEDLFDKNASQMKLLFSRGSLVEDKVKQSIKYVEETSNSIKKLAANIFEQLTNENLKINKILQDL